MKNNSTNKSYAFNAESGAPNSHDTISIMTEQQGLNTNATQPNAAPAESDWIANAIRTGRMLSSREVMTMFGYRSRASFWAWCAKAQPPHVRLSSRNIKFPAAAMKEWLAKRSNTEGLL